MGGEVGAGDVMGVLPVGEEDGEHDECGWIAVARAVPRCGAAALGALVPAALGGLGFPY